MNNVKRSWTSDYTQVSNALVNCYGLSPMTRFLCIFLSAQANTFQFNNAMLCKALDCSPATLRKYMKEAIEHGLIERERKVINGKFGYFDYTLIDPTTLQNLPHGKKTNVEKNQRGKNVRLNKEEVLTNVSTINKQESPIDDCVNVDGKLKKKTAAQKLTEKAEKTLAFFNDYTGKSLTSAAYLKAIKAALRRKATSQDLAFAIYEQEYNTRNDVESRRKFLSPLTICREANLARLSDRWRGRSKEEQRKIVSGAPKYTSADSNTSLSWSDWPTPAGWRKDLSEPGYYTHTGAGRKHYTEMITSRMAKADFFPAFLQAVA